MLSVRETGIHIGEMKTLDMTEHEYVGSFQFSFYLYCTHVIRMV